MLPDTLIVACPRCGAEAEASNISSAVASMNCPECGPFDLSRTEFDIKETDQTE